MARDGAPVVLHPGLRERLVRARAVVERAACGDAPVYGVTTALGASKDVAVAAGERAGVQRGVIAGRSVAVGPAMPTDVVRAVLVARAAAMAAGGSGVSPAVLDALVALLNAGVHPVLPRWGSVGAADLGPLATLALPLIGLGEAELRGDRLPGAVALERAGITAPALGAKDGLALVSANAVSAGHGALVVADALAAIDALAIAAALSMEGFRANLSPLDPRAQAARPAPGQRDAAARFTALLAGSPLWEAGAARSFQDPLSFRCASQIHGAALAAVGHARACVEIELNAAGDNPLVVDDGILHTGNFHVAALAQAFDLVAISLAHLASAAAERTIRLMSPAASGLPYALTPRGASHTGFATVQKTITSLVAQMRHLANPGSLDFLPVSEGVEDHATNAPFTVAKAADAVDRLTYVAAIELMVAAQAVDLRAPGRMGRGARGAWDTVRRIVPRLDDDRPPGADIERLRAAVVAGDLARAV